MYHVELIIIWRKKNIKKIKQQPYDEIEISRMKSNFNHPNIINLCHKRLDEKFTENTYNKIEELYMGIYNIPDSETNVTAIISISI